MDIEAFEGVMAANEQNRPLRLWPGVVIVTLLLLSRFGLKLVVPGFDGFSMGMLGSLGLTLVLLCWWAFFSRAEVADRLGGILLIAVGLGVAWALKHPSMSPLWLVGYAVPFSCLAFVLWAVLTKNSSLGRQRLALLGTMLIAGGGWALLKTDGIDGDHVATFSWRWSATPEMSLMATAETPADGTLAPESDLTSHWPGFRGPDRDGIVVDSPGRLQTDWQAIPPTELWRRPIGPSWSSFAVAGDYLFTQEQRGEEELVSCYRASTGEPVWQKADPVRFFESNGGAGPRSTPTLFQDQVFALGGTGLLNALDIRTGKVLWSRDVAQDTGAAVPVWGFSGSPLVVDDLVIVLASGTAAAYDRNNGEPRWQGPEEAESYSSPQLVTLQGVTQVLLLHGGGLSSVAPADGKLLWSHEWAGFPILQPALTVEGDILLSVSAKQGTRRLSVTQGEEGWAVETQWTSTQLKPYFNDLVVHKGHAYGFDGRMLACIDLSDGKRTWKGGRYGSGQMTLLPANDLLLVLAEKGDLVLVEAVPGQFREVTRLAAVKGKTWNHPVVVGDTLYVRNAAEMVAFQLPVQMDNQL